jgi:hypothetical protein
MLQAGCHLRSGSAYERSNAENNGACDACVVLPSAPAVTRKGRARNDSSETSYIATSVALWRVTYLNCHVSFTSTRGSYYHS